MDFKDVDAASLRSALTTCKSAINYSKSKSVRENLNGSDRWQSNAKQNLTTAIDTLVNERYKSLEEKIDTYLQVASLIEEYKQLESNNEALTKNSSSLKNNLYKDKDKKEIDTTVQSKLKANEQKISQQKSKMNSLKSQIISMI